jgi:hypothetical protein
MSHCIDINSEEFKNLYEKLFDLGVLRSKEVVAAKIVEWQLENGIDNFPTLADFNIQEKSYEDLYDYYKITILDFNNKPVTAQKIKETTHLLSNLVVQKYYENKDKIEEFFKKSKKLSLEEFQNQLKELEDQNKIENLLADIENSFDSIADVIVDLINEDIEYDEEYHGTQMRLPNDEAELYKLQDEYDLIFNSIEKYKPLILSRLQTLGYSFKGGKINEKIKSEEDNAGSSESESLAEELMENTKIYDKSFLEENPKDKLSAKVKWFLHRIPDGKVNFLNQPSYVDFEVLYKDLLNLFSNAGRDYKTMMKILEVESLHKPYIENLITEIEKAPIETKVAFFTGLMNVSNNHTTLIGNKKSIKPVDSLTSSKRKVILEEWYNNRFSAPIYINDVSGKLQYNKEYIKNELTEFINEINDIDVQDYDSLKTYTLEYLRRLGVNFSSEAYDYLRENFIELSNNKEFRLGTFERSKIGIKRYYSKEIKVLEKKYSESPEILEEEINKLLEDGFFKLGFIKDFIKGRIHDYLVKNAEIRYKTESENQDENEEETLEERSVLEGSLTTQERSLKVLAYYEARFNSKITTDSYRTHDGKTIFNHSNSTATSRVINSIISKDGDINTLEIKALLAVDHLQFNDILNTLNLEDTSNNEKKLNWARSNFKISYLDALKNYSGRNKSSASYKEMSTRERLITNLSLYFNGGNSDTAHYIGTSKSDKHLTQVITWKKYNEKEQLDRTLNIIKSEWSRYYKGQNAQHNYQGYKPDMFYYFPELNSVETFPEFYDEEGKLTEYKEEFKDNNINLCFLKSEYIEYKQLENKFIPWLSIIDIIMFT